MAIVPTYDRKIITTAPLRPANLDNVSPEAFGAGLGRDIQRAGQIVQSQILEPAWQEANQARVNDAAVKLGQKRLELTQKLRDAKGEQSLVVADQVSKDFGTYRDEVRKSLANDAQRAAFDPHANSYGLDIQELIGSHTDLEMKKVSASRADSLEKQNIQFAIEMKNDPERALDKLNNAVKIHDDYAKTKGVPDETRALETSNIRSETLTEIIQSHIDNKNIAAAQDWFNKHKEEISPKQRDDLIKLFEVEHLRGQSQKAADEIVSGAMASNSTPDGVHSGDWAATVTQAMAGVQSIQDPKLRDETENRVQRALSMAQKVEGERQQQTFKRAWDIVTAPGTTTDDIPATDWAALDVGQRDHLRAVTQQKIRGPRVESDMPTWLRINDLFSDPSKKQAASTLDLTRYLGDLSPADLKQFSDRQQKIKSGDDTGLVHDSLVNSIVQQTMALNKMPRGSEAKGDAEAQAAATYERAVYDAVVAERKAGKPVERERVQKIADDLILEQKVARSWYNPARWFGDNEASGKRIFQLADEVPASERKLVIEGFRKANKRDPNPAEILKTWQVGQTQAQQKATQEDNAKRDAVVPSPGLSGLSSPIGRISSGRIYP